MTSSLLVLLLIWLRILFYPLMTSSRSRIWADSTILLAWKFSQVMTIYFSTRRSIFKTWFPRLDCSMPMVSLLLWQVHVSLEHVWILVRNCSMMNPFMVVQLVFYSISVSLDEISILQWTSWVNTCKPLVLVTAQQYFMLFDIWRVLWIKVWCFEHMSVLVMRCLWCLTQILIGGICSW